MMNSSHITVFLNQAIELLKVQKDNWYLDATFGSGGHTKKILDLGGKVLSLDFDQQAIKAGHLNFANEIEEKRLILVQSNFNQMDQVVNKVGLEGKISGVLFDFGTSTNQLMSEERGFSFFGEGELDMRMDLSLGVKAKDLLALLSEKQLADVFFEYGGEQEAKKIARQIVKNRKMGKFIQTTKDLTELIERCKTIRGKTHPATKVFQALRILVNDEMTNISLALPLSLRVANDHARIVAISFHEGEDRQVKVAFKNWEERGDGQIITKKAIEPDFEEVTNNPRSRSAKLRAFEKNEK